MPHLLFNYKTVFFLLFCSTIIAQKEMSEMEVLKKIMEINPDSKLKWQDLTEENFNRENLNVLNLIRFYSKQDKEKEGYVKSISLRSKDISVLPKEIKYFKYLKSFDLAHNNIEKLPDEIGSIKSLKRLDLEGNNLNRLPKSLSKLTNLSNINLSKNKFDKFPLVLLKLGGNLSSIYLKTNSISELPKGLYKLKKIKSLYLNDNKLSVLPESLVKLEKLKHLDVQQNPIKYISKEICNLGINIEKEANVTCTDDLVLNDSFDKSIEKKIRSLFNDYKPIIEASQNAEIDETKLFLGDLNDDKENKKDGLLYFTFKNSAEKTYPQIAIYTSYENEIGVYGGFEPTFMFKVIKIENNLVYIRKSGKIVTYILEDRTLKEKK